MKRRNLLAPFACSDSISFHVRIVSDGPCQAIWGAPFQRRQPHYGSYSIATSLIYGKDQGQFSSLVDGIFIKYLVQCNRI